jgi:hypothetical protein
MENWCAGRTHTGGSKSGERREPYKALAGTVVDLQLSPTNRSRPTCALSPSGRFPGVSRFHQKHLRQLGDQLVARDLHAG